MLWYLFIYVCTQQSNGTVSSLWSHASEIQISMFKSFFFYRVDISRNLCHFKQISAPCSAPHQISHMLGQEQQEREGVMTTTKRYVASLQIKKMPNDQIMVQHSTLCMDVYFQMDKIQIDGS